MSAKLVHMITRRHAGRSTTGAVSDRRRRLELGELAGLNAAMCHPHIVASICNPVATTEVAPRADLDRRRVAALHNLQRAGRYAGSATSRTPPTAPTALSTPKTKIIAALHSRLELPGLAPSSMGRPRWLEGAFSS